MKRFNLEMGERSCKIIMIENEHMYQTFIMLTFDFNFLIKFCRDDLLIISTKFYKKFIRLTLEIYVQYFMIVSYPIMIKPSYFTISVPFGKRTHKPTQPHYSQKK